MGVRYNSIGSGEGVKKVSGPPIGYSFYRKSHSYSNLPRMWFTSIFISSFIQKLVGTCNTSITVNVDENCSQLLWQWTAHVHGLKRPLADKPMTRNFTFGQIAIYELNEILVVLLVQPMVLYPLYSIIFGLVRTQIRNSKPKIAFGTLMLRGGGMIFAALGTLPYLKRVESNDEDWVGWHS